MKFFVALCVAVCAALALPASALAQSGPRDRQTRAMISQAMEDYNSLELEHAVERLQAAVRGCNNNQCSAAVTARVYMSLGIVAVGGQQDNNAGINYMTQALQIDANQQPDQLLVTPEITAAFNQATARAQGSGNTSTNPPPTGRSPPVGRNPLAGSGTLLHTPPAEQLENTPLPVYVEASGMTPEHVYLFFKGTGMGQYRRVEMRHVASGYGVEIPCGQVIQGSIEYYLTAVDSGGETLGTAGSDTAPVRVNIVTRRTQVAPSLPGALAPETCGEECPPGMSGPQCRGSVSRGTAGMGDPCTGNECGVGLHCDGGACAPGEAPAGGDDHAEPGAPSRFARFSLDVGGGIGFAFLSGRPSYAEARVGVDAMGMRTGAVDCGMYVCSTNIDTGFAATYYLSAMARYNITNRFGIAAGLRFQFDTADTSVRAQPLSNLLLTGRLYIAVTPQGFIPIGVTGSVFVGGGGGQIEPKPALPSRETRPSAHVVSGFGNAQAGARVEYGVRNGFHVASELALQFMFPTFLFDIDVTVLLGFHI